MRSVDDAQVVRREPTRVTGHNAGRNLWWRMQQG
jgi:hypothetical protein